MVQGRIEPTPAEQLKELRKARDRYAALAERLHQSADVEPDPEEKLEQERNARRILQAYEKSIANSEVRMSSMDGTHGVAPRALRLRTWLAVFMVVSAVEGGMLLAYFHPAIFQAMFPREIMEKFSRAMVPVAPPPKPFIPAPPPIIQPGAPPPVAPIARPRTPLQVAAAPRPIVRPQTPPATARVARPQTPPPVAAPKPIVQPPPPGAASRPIAQLPPVAAPRPSAQSPTPPPITVAPATPATPPVAAQTPAAAAPPPLPALLPTPSPAPSPQSPPSSQPNLTAAVPPPTRLEPIAGTHTAPPYPAVSKGLGETGSTRMRLAISAQGAAAECAIAKSSGSERLDAAACSHVQQYWRWKPATQGGQPVAANTTVTIVWNLRSAR